MVVGTRHGDTRGVNASQNAYFYRMFAELSAAVPDEPCYGDIAEGIRAGLAALVEPRLASSTHRVTRFVPDMYVRKEGQLVPFETSEANVFGGCTVMVSEVTQYWLLWSNVLTPAQQQRLWEVLRNWRSFEIPLRDNTRMLNPARASSVMGLCPRFKYALARHDPVIYRDARDAFGPNVLRETTLWESLELDSRAVVHPTTPYVGKVLYEGLTGIRTGNADNKVRIEPIIDDNLEWARGYKETSSGLIGVNWQRRPGAFILHVGLPAATTAIVKLPAGVIGMLQSHRHAVPDSGIVRIDQSVDIIADTVDGLTVAPR
jgi:hypothetical protein